MSRGRPGGRTGAGGGADGGRDGGSRAWEFSAACRHQDGDLWFSRRSWSRAMAICAACPVLDHCRDAVLQREKGLPRCRRNGVIAGLTGPQRYALESRANRQTNRRPQARTPPPADPDAAHDPAGPPRGQPPPCGTRAGYQRHLRRREPVDEACRAANARGAGRYRRTGSTRARQEDTRARDRGGAMTPGAPPRN
ncbi:WhiB family transcriptional regulator [Streptomyces phaeofaciens]|uniref:WhiB family transcriptional regulator n=1 Tax=Streptomyces phaeofaciens TaxID=68254 RepID=UPI0036C61E61